MHGRQPNSHRLDGSGVSRCDRIQQSNSAHPFSYPTKKGHTHTHTHTHALTHTLTHSLTHTHLAKDAACAPHVHLRAIQLGPEQQLWRAVVPGDDAIRVLPPHRRAEHSRQPKVGYLQPAPVVDEQVRGLEVAMEHVLAVAKVESLHQVPHKLAAVRVCERHGGRGLKQARKVVLHVLKHLPAQAQAQAQTQAQPQAQTQPQPGGGGKPLSAKEKFVIRKAQPGTKAARLVGLPKPLAPTM